ncbi:MAG: Sir2 family NAD-dependent protein deacetylase [Kofleriaceae bacterium]
MDRVVAACRSALERPGTVIVLTGAGVSAESGIPTFRGSEGYWTVGAREYHPQELATRQAFATMPWDVWAWYLYRRGVCRAAAPNDGHYAIARWDDAMKASGDRFALVTQNIDGLHRRAGSPAARTFAIHGELDQMRCAAECVDGDRGDTVVVDRWPIPTDVPGLARGEAVSEATKALLVCPRCGEMARPHVLWFDEAYDEPRFHLDTVRELASAATLCVVVGTSAQTNLPWQVVMLAARNAATIIDINPEPNPFGEIAERSGGVIRAPSAVVLPGLIDQITGR